MNTLKTIIKIDKKLIPNIRILVLEDDVQRIKWFKSVLIGVVADFAVEAQEAIDLVNKNKYDIIFLDHDLGGKQMVDVNEFNTGSTVAKVIAGKDWKDDCDVIIHTYNPDGRENMRAIINSFLCKIYPYGTFDIDIEGGD